LFDIDITGEGEADGTERVEGGVAFGGADEVEDYSEAEHFPYNGLQPLPQ
jgi:hypothetical protein